MMNPSEIEESLTNFVNDALSFSKAQSHIKKKQKQKAPYIMKDPSKYDYKKSLTAIHKGEIGCITLLQNGNLISGSLDSSVKIWDPNTGQTFKTYEGHINQVTHIIELVNGNIASCSTDKTINIWDRHSGKILYTLEGFETEIKQISEVDADNLVILSEEEKAFAVWSYRKELEDNCHYYEDHQDRINHMLVVANKFVFSASTDRTIKRWTMKNKDKPQLTYEGHEEAVLKLAYIDNKLIASGSGDTTIKIWDISSKDPLV